MAQKDSNKRLGRGLAALIGDLDKPKAAGKSDAAAKSDTKNTGKKTAQKTDAKSAASGEAIELRPDRKIPIEHIRANPNNPRRFFSEDNLTDLARSIGEHGIVQPVLVRPIKTGGEDLGGAKFEIIAGERRWRAAQKAGLHEIPVLIREVEDKQALELAIIENVQRADLNPVEEALGYQQLIDEYDYTQADLGDVIGKSRSHVANTLRLLKLPEPVQKLLSSGALSAGHARALVTAEDPLSLADRIVKNGLSVRQAEQMAQTPKQQDKKSIPAPETKSLDLKSPDIKAMETRLEDLLGLKIDIRHGKGESGEIRFFYKTLDQLEDIIRRIEKK